MTTRNTAIIAAVTLLLGIYVVAFDRGGSGLLRDFRIVPIAETAEDIVALKIASASGEISLQRDASTGAWKMTAPVSDRADGQKIDKLLGELVRLKRVATFEEDVPPESVLGLSESALSIEVTSAAGESGLLKLGGDAAMEGDIYARWGEGPPFLCWEDARALASVPHEKLRDVRLLAIPPDQMRRMKFKDETEASLVLDQAAPKGPWRVLKPFDTPANPEAIDKRLTILSSIGAKDFIDAPDGDVAAAFAAGTMTVSIWQHGERGATTELKLARSADGAAAYAKASDREATFSISPTFFRDLTLNPNDVRDRRLVAFNPRSVFGISVTAKPDHQVSLQKSDSGWDLVGGESPVPASAGNVVTMLKALATEEVAAFVADAVAPAGLSKWGLDAPTLTIRLATAQQDPENPFDEDGQANIIQVPISILVKGMVPENQPAMKFFATVEGSGTVVRLNAAFPTIVPYRLLDYRSLYLWPSFLPMSLHQLSLSNPPSAALELQYLPPTNDWTGTLAGGDVSARLDVPQLSTLVNELGQPLRAVRWVTKPQPQAEAAAALATPVKRLRFVLKDPEGKDFNFGLDVVPINPDSPFLYARPLGSKDVCIIDRKTFELLDAPLVQPGAAAPE